MMGYVYITGTILFTLYGQLILKWRITQYGLLPQDMIDKIIFLFKVFLDPYVLSGFLAAFASSFFWMAAMTKFDLSNAYPIIVGGLAILTSLIAVLIFKEPVTFYKILGIGLIVVGVYFVGKV